MAELATFLLMLETIREDEPHELRWTTFNPGNAVAIASGSLLGGTARGVGPVGARLHGDLRTLERLRLLVLSSSSSEWTGDVRRLTELPTMPLAVRTNVGSMDRPMLSVLEESAASERPS
ncbi:MAG: hypothetical protein U0575_05155 [Phycisphaerales bacterium]